MFIFFSWLVIRKKKEIKNEDNLDEKKKNFWFFLVDCLREGVKGIGYHDIEILIVKDFLIALVIVFMANSPKLVIISLLALLLISFVFNLVYKPSADRIEYHERSFVFTSHDPILDDLLFKTKKIRRFREQFFGNSFDNFIGSYHRVQHGYLFGDDLQNCQEAMPKE
jgi:cell division protein FtsW (lipid II flippase)